MAVKVCEFLVHVLLFPRIYPKNLDCFSPAKLNKHRGFCFSRCYHKRIKSDFTKKEKLKASLQYLLSNLKSKVFAVFRIYKFPRSVVFNPCAIYITIFYEVIAVACAHIHYPFGYLFKLILSLQGSTIRVLTTEWFFLKDSTHIKGFLSEAFFVSAGK